MISCPSCARAQAPALLCTGCGAPLGANIDLFAALNLPRRLVIDAAAMERAYHDLSRRIHPDRFAAAPAAARDASMRATALLTRAYRTLRDPVSRGRYWLELHGRKLGENNQRVPAELAAMVFETQERLEELRASRTPENLAAARARREEVAGALEAATVALARNFAAWDEGGEEADERRREALFTDLKAILSKFAYLTTLERDIGRELETARAA
jgi:molecular chaperone HscB